VRTGPRGRATSAGREPREGATPRSGENSFRLLRFDHDFLQNFE
jgi:hypothetical protein